MVALMPKVAERRNGGRELEGSPTIATKCGRNHFSWSARTRLKENGIEYSTYPMCISNFTKNEKGSEWWRTEFDHVYIHSLSLSEYKQYCSIPRREATHLYGSISVLPPFFPKNFINDILKIFQDQTEMAETVFKHTLTEKYK